MSEPMVVDPYRVTLVETTVCSICYRPMPKGSIARTDGIRFWHPDPCVT